MNVCSMLQNSHLLPEESEASCLCWLLLILSVVVVAKSLCLSKGSAV